MVDAQQQEHPVAQRLRQIDERWTSFVESPHGTVFCVVMTPAERVFIDAFIGLEENPELADTPDVFLRLDAAVGSTAGVGRALRDQVVARHEATSEARHELGLAGDWQAPEPTADDTQAFVDTCTSYHAYFQLPARLVLVVEPDLNGDPIAWRRFVAEFAARSPTSLALFVCESAEAGALAGLEVDYRHRLVRWRADLDLAAALAATCARTDDADQPAGAFRTASVETTAALADGDLATAVKSGDRAIEIAATEQWPHLAAGMHVTLGAALVGAPDRLDEALLRFEAAESAAVESEAAGEPSARPLRLRARLARGALLISAERYDEAAACYEQTVPFAEAGEDGRACLDCWRLASLAHELAHRPEPAWSCGHRGLEVARGLDAQTRETSTIGYLGVALLRLAEQRDDPTAAARIERELVEITDSKDWRPVES